MTFRVWLRKQEGVDSPVGDLVSDAKRDLGFPKSGSLDTYLRHLDRVGASDQARRVLREAYARWLVEVAP